MTKQEKEQRIKELQTEKKALTPAIKESFQERNIAFKSYTVLNNNWLKLKTEWEKFDKEEKLLFFSIPENKTTIRNKTTIKSIADKAKEKALKSLASLPPEIREQVLANFK